MDYNQVAGGKGAWQCQKERYWDSDVRGPNSYSVETRVGELWKCFKPTLPPLFSLQPDVSNQADRPGVLQRWTTFYFTQFLAKIMCPFCGFVLSRCFLASLHFLRALLTCLHGICGDPLQFLCRSLTTIHLPKGHFGCIVKPSCLCVSRAFFSF